MSKIFITGDIHGSVDIHKLNSKNFPEGLELTRDDYVIICGDFGLVWGGKYQKEFNWWIKWLNDRKWTTLFVDGNHENFDLLNAYPVEEWHGGKIHRISQNIIHLMRGEIFDICGYSFFAFGGAFSHDVIYRIENMSWWQNELPTHEEVQNGIDHLKAHDFKVDVILTHDAPSDVIQVLNYHNASMEIYDPQYEHIQLFLQYVKENVDFKAWFLGHYHINRSLLNFHILYDEIIELTPWILQK